MTNLNILSKSIQAIFGVVSVHYVTVTPEVAKKWLENAVVCGFHNRPKKSAAVSKYANEIAQGSWHDTFDPIHLAVENGLAFPVNGQHRLHAVILADTPVNFLVVSGVDRNAFKYYDQGQTRTLDQILEIAKRENDNGKWKYPKDQATVARKLYKQDVTGTPGSPIAKINIDNGVQDGAIYDFVSEKYPTEIDDVFEKYNVILSSISKGRKVDGYSEVKGFGPKSTWAFFTQRAIETGNTKRLHDLLRYFDNPAANPDAHKALRALCRFIETIRAGSEIGTEVKTRHKDYAESIIAGLYVAWNVIATNQKLANLTPNAFISKNNPTIWYKEFEELVHQQILSKSWVLQK